MAGKRGHAALHEVVNSLLRRYEMERDSSETADKVILVLGAGASFSSGMPAWKEIKKELLSAAERCFQRGRFVEEAWRKLGPFIGLPPTDPIKARETLLARADVERILSVACETTVAGDCVRDVLVAHYRKEIKDKIDMGPAPQLCCELIAHLLRHRYVDHVVTFNFDEVLDIAVRNELGDDECEIIISDKQPMAAQTLSPDRPRVIKLHGTISSPASLCFTRDDVSVMSPDIIRILDQSAFGDGRQDVHIISLGYSWCDHDFIHWVQSRVEHISRVTVVQWEDSPPALLSAVAEDVNIDVFSVEKVCRRAGSAAARQLLSVDHVLWSVVRELEGRLREQEIPFVPAARHIILGVLFGPRRVRDRLQGAVDEIREYRNVHAPNVRLLVELYLHMIKCKGIVNVSVMARDPRIRRYWRVYCSDSSERQLDDLIDVERSRSGGVKETYFSTAATPRDLFSQLLEDDDINHRGKTPELRLCRTSVRLETRGTGDLIREHLREIYRASETEVTPSMDPRCEWLFSDPQALTTYRRFRRRTEELLARDWSDLLVIAESGAWLFDERVVNLLGGRRADRASADGDGILLIAGTEGLGQWGLWRDHIRAEIDKKREELRGYRTCTTTIPWWRHNRHLTLAIDRRGKQCLIGGTYFRRRLKTSRISPVFVERNPIDCGELLLMFMTYTDRALSPEATDMHDETDIRIRVDFAREVMEVASCVTLAKLGGRTREARAFIDRKNSLSAALEQSIGRVETRRAPE